MKTLFVALFLMLATTLFGQTSLNIDSLNKARATEAIGRAFPSFQAFAGKSVFTNKGFAGKVVFINFWFEECAPCMAEFDALNELYVKLKDRKDFQFISFTFETQEKIREIKNKFHIQYQVAWIDKQDCYRLNQNNGFPTSIVLDTNGTIKYLTTGGNIDKSKARKFVMSEIYSEVLQQF